MATLLWGWIKPLLEVVLPFWFKQANNATTTIEHEKTPTKIADINESDYNKWLREHKGDNL